MIGWLVFVCLANQPISALAASPRVVIVLSQESAPSTEMVKGFQSALVGTGVEPQLEVHNLEGRPENAISVGGKLKDESPALFVTVGSLATQMILARHEEVPVIASLTAHLDTFKKRGNLTGVSLEISLEDQFDAMRRIFPSVASIGVLYSPKANQDLIDSAGAVAKRVGLRFVPRPVETPHDIPDALEGLANKIDLLWGIPDQVVISSETAEPILLYSFRNKIPFAGLSTPWVKAGALYALDRDYGDIGSQCAEIAVKVLNKTPLRALPIVSPRKVLFFINLKTARTMNIELTSQILNNAKQVFQ